MSFITRYVYTYEEFVFVTEATAVQQNDSESKTQIIKVRPVEGAHPAVFVGPNAQYSDGDTLL